MMIYQQVSVSSTSTPQAVISSAQDTSTLSYDVSVNNSANINPAFVAGSSESNKILNNLSHQLQQPPIHNQNEQTKPEHHHHQLQPPHLHQYNHGNHLNYEYTSIKSKIGVEFRRYALKREDISSFDNFYKKIEFFHQLDAIPFVIFYTDAEDFLLPINNNDNLAKAISSAKHISLYDRKQMKSLSNQINNNNVNNNHTIPSNNSNNNNNNINDYNLITSSTHNQIQQVTIIRRPFLKLFVEKKGVFLQYYNGNLSGKYKKGQPFKGLSTLIPSTSENNVRPSIGMPEDFRRVSSIIDVDKVPETCRRVKIVKHGSDRPLGFYIRDGTYKRMNAHGQLELVTGIFISRLVPGGLAESTGLLAVNDEVLEVNGIQVTHGKTLDQVTDMMVANSSNLIITIRPGKLNELP